VKWHSDGVIDDFSTINPLRVADLFDPGLVEARRVPGGHIHLTWKAVDGDGDEYAVQALNSRVFPDTAVLVGNLIRISAVLRGAGVPIADSAGVGPGRGMSHRHGGRVWRASRWVQGHHPNPADPVEVRKTSAAFGRFDRALVGLDGIHQVIDHFHDPALRYQRMDRAIGLAPPARCRALAATRDRIGELWPIVAPAAAARSGLPGRVCHNDAKLVNAIVADDGRMVIIDLDTVMPGTIIDDVGELVRSVARPVEDDASGSTVPLGMVEAVMEGFGEFSSHEAALLPWSGLILTIENAMRFLTDFADGDIYFAVTDPEQNLRRAAAQVDLAEQLLAAHDQITVAASNAIRG